MTGPLIRDALCVTASIGLVLAGMFLTGILPSGTRYQLFAGACIVSGFALGYVCLDEWD